MQSNFFPLYLSQAAKIYVATFHSVVRLETIEISEQRTAFIWIFAQEVDWCIKDCDKERVQTTAFIDVWKIFPGYTGDWLDVKTASTCTTELWDALKSFILDSLKIKVAPHPIIVSLDTLMHFHEWKNSPNPLTHHSGWFDWLPWSSLFLSVCSLCSSMLSTLLWISLSCHLDKATCPPFDTRWSQPFVAVICSIRDHTETIPFILPTNTNKNLTILWRF